jgi:hypothetical protein
MRFQYEFINNGFKGFVAFIFSMCNMMIITVVVMFISAHMLCITDVRYYYHIVKETPGEWSGYYVSEETVQTLFEVEQEYFCNWMQC